MRSFIAAATLFIALLSGGTAVLAAPRAPVSAPISGGPPANPLVLLGGLPKQQQQRARATIPLPLAQKRDYPGPGDDREDSVEQRYPSPFASDSSSYSDCTGDDCVQYDGVYHHADTNRPVAHTDRPVEHHAGPKSVLARATFLSVWRLFLSRLSVCLSVCLLNCCVLDGSLCIYLCRLAISISHKHYDWRSTLLDGSSVSSCLTMCGRKLELSGGDVFKIDAVIGHFSLPRSTRKCAF
ncbi:hypothetical protein DFH11DRAFT_1562376 [Phellopilus nigrolimitatus]|nr:hypothetical protein DFH11DRAFT_1562376 [Phellopilus nigrolimitatus]